MGIKRVTGIWATVNTGHFWRLELHGELTFFALYSSALFEFITIGRCYLNFKLKNYLEKVHQIYFKTKNKHLLGKMRFSNY